MSVAYNPQDIELRWQKNWEENKTFKAVEDPERPKYYVLDMFPYPSAHGLHVGHPLSYTATDIIARYKRMRGFNVLHPMGWDAFGLPAEQHAIQTGTHPAVTTQRNIDNFRKQIKRLGFSYDWDREINTTDPKYYKWTQWIFLQLFKKGLAYEAEIPVNWCPALGTVLANEEVIDGKSERGGHPVIRKPMRQWMLKITAYAESLLVGLDELDWPEHVKELQRNWIGKSTGAEVYFNLPSINEVLTVFTTRPDTLFGATYMVMAPEHPFVERLTTAEQKSEVQDYQALVATKSDLARTELSKEKTGVFTGAYAINPVNGKEIQVWISDYVLMSYGTGAIMAVPAHDQRDWEFARKFNLRIQEVVSGGDIERGAFTDIDNGIMINSETPDGRFSINGLVAREAIKKITDWLESEQKGKATVQYKLRDWLFSRQRYWGEPIPVIHYSDRIEPVNEEDLPLTLPEVKDYHPTGTGEPPLAKVKDWVEIPDGGRRETNTMPQWAGSCWYYLRYLDPNNEGRPWDKEKENYWMPVDIYIGGQEHAVLHLLYARFWHHVLHDLGLVSTREPFKKLYNQGMILGEDGTKMSKSRGNVVNPDDVIAEFGADAVRLYEMFMGPLDKTKPWSTKGLQGCARFLQKVWDFFQRVEVVDDEPDDQTKRFLHKTIKKVTEDIESLGFNTAISQMMIFMNQVSGQQRMNRQVLITFLKLLNPFAPHLCEELNRERLGQAEELAYQDWPDYDPQWIVDDQVVVAIQVNGKMRGKIQISRDASKESVLQKAKDENNVKKYLEQGSLVKEIYVPNRLVNFVVR